MKKNDVTIIAEAGVNHNGSIKQAKKLIDVAANSGADYIKFQSFIAEKNISKKAAKAKYQIESTNSSESQLEMIKKLELSEEQHFELVDYCNSKNIKFLSTAFDIESVNLLEKISIDFFKIPSGDITNLPLLKRISHTKKPVVISTGMSTLDEISETVNIFTEAGLSKNEITLLHCNTEYPTPFEDVNLNAMLTIKDNFNTKVGYSDHTLGIEVPIAAVALGAKVIEKHFTLDRSLPGPDHRASLEPNELHQMVKAIRNINLALGTGVKAPSNSEKKNIKIARKSIHTSRKLKKGSILKEEDLIMLRPGDGINPMEYEKFIGKIIIHDLEENHKLNWADVQ